MRYSRLFFHLLIHDVKIVNNKTHLYKAFPEKGEKGLSNRTRPSSQSPAKPCQMDISERSSPRRATLNPSSNTSRYSPHIREKLSHNIPKVLSPDIDYPDSDEEIEKPVTPPKPTIQLEQFTELLTNFLKAKENEETRTTRRESGGTTAKSTRESTKRVTPMKVAPPKTPLKGSLTPAKLNLTNYRTSVKESKPILTKATGMQNNHNQGQRTSVGNSLAVKTTLKAPISKKSSNLKENLTKSLSYSKVFMRK